MFSLLNARLGDYRGYFLLVIGVLAIILLVAACNEGGPADPSSTVDSKKYKAIVLTYNGAPLRCIERKGSTGNQVDSGAYSGLTCDWVAYHGKEFQR